MVEISISRYLPASAIASVAHSTASVRVQQRPCVYNDDHGLWIFKGCFVDLGNGFLVNNKKKLRGLIG